LLCLGVCALVMPAVFGWALYGSLVARPPALEKLSFWSSIILVVAYASSLVYAFRTDRDLFRSARGDEPDVRMTTTAAITLLAAGTVLTAIQAEVLVGALQPALTRFGLTELFVGVIVVAIVGNAAEHY